MESLEVIRRDYRKNSLAKASSPCYVQSDEEEGIWIHKRNLQESTMNLILKIYRERDIVQFSTAKQAFLLNET